MIWPDRLEQVAVLVLAHIDDLPEDHARKMIGEHRNADHFGDCTDMASTCVRCRVDEAFDLAAKVCAVFAAAPADPDLPQPVRMVD
jgi:hypothetical protein